MFFLATISFRFFFNFACCSMFRSIAIKVCSRIIAVIRICVLLFAQTGLKEQISGLFIFPDRVVNF